MTDQQADQEQPTATLLPGLVQRPPELGRIRMGEKNERGLPVKLTTFRLTSHSRATLEAAAALYGGTVKPWRDAPDEGMYELTTAASELDILIPGSLAVIGQSYELWQGGTAERRCDGTTEARSGSPCLCAAAGLEGGDRVCDIVTRLRVMLPRVPGFGVWRLDTSGYMAATTLPATVQLIARMTPGAWIPAVLRAEQRSKRERVDGKAMTHRFVVPVLDLPGMTIDQALNRGGSDAVPLLEEGDEPPRPKTAADRVAEKRAQVEAQAGAPEVRSASSGATAPQGAASAPAPTAGQCDRLSPKGDRCVFVPGHDGDHKAGRVTWPESASKSERAPAGDSEAREEAAAGDATPAADLTSEAAAVFAEDVVIEGTAREVRDEVPPEVQAGMDLLKGGR